MIQKKKEKRSRAITVYGAIEKYTILQKNIDFIVPYFLAFW